MTGPHSPETLETPLTDPALVLAALARILATAAFRQNEALARLLRFAVEESLAGRRCKVKRGPAAKLRVQLSAYYSGEGLHDPVRIRFLEDGASLMFTSVVTPAAPPVGARSARHRWVWIPVALAAVGLLMWAGNWWRARAASAEIRSIAILPLAGLSPQEDGDWFSGGITGELIDDLSRVPGLHVAARTSAFAVKGDARDVGQQLGTAAVLLGTVGRASGRLQITVRMIRSADGYRLWQATFDRPAQDVVTVQEAITDAIAARIQIPPPARPPHRHQPPPPAYSAYLQGRSLFPGDVEKAVGRLEEATRLDPEFASAWAWLSIVREYRVAAGLARPNQAMPGSRDAAERAVALDSECVAAHLAMGIVKLQYDWDWAAAKEEFDRVLQMNPGSALALQWRARWYQTQGRSEESISETQRALALDPLSPSVLSDAAVEYLSANQTERALSLAQKAHELNPDDAALRAALAELSLLAGQKEKARQMAAELHNGPPPLMTVLAAQLTDAAGARRMLDEAEDLPDDQLMPAITYAQVAAAVLDWDRFFLWLQEAYGERDLQLPYLRLNPSMPKRDPRFAGFLAQMNLPGSQ